MNWYQLVWFVIKIVIMAYDYCNNKTCLIEIKQKFLGKTIWSTKNKNILQIRKTVLVGYHILVQSLFSFVVEVFPLTKSIFYLPLVISGI